MPEYFFDFLDGHTAITDDVGSELIDDEAAQREASSALFDLIRSTTLLGKRSLSISVRDTSGQLIYIAELDFRGFNAFSSERSISHTN